MHEVAAPSPILPADARCLGCGYRLEGLIENRCPECARAFKPDDPLTFQIGPSRPLWARIAARPSLVETIVASVFGISILVEASDPSGSSYSFVPFMLSMLCMLFIGPLWLLRAITCFFYPAQLDQTRTHRSRSRWLPLPIAIMFLISVMVTDWPLRLRFAASKGAFDDAAKKALAGQFTAPCRVGLYQIEEVEVRASNSGARMVFFTTGWGFLDPAGFMFVEGGASQLGRINLTSEWTTFEY